MGRFSQQNVRVMKEATTDQAYPQFSATRDLPMLLAFLEQFDRLGWLPPLDAEKQRILAAHDVIIHLVRDDLSFYEFCSKGARGERDPWISIFFHVGLDATVRICGVERTEMLAGRRAAALSRMRLRVDVLDRWLRR